MPARPLLRRPSGAGDDRDQGRPIYVPRGRRVCDRRNGTEGRNTSDARYPSPPTDQLFPGQARVRRQGARHRRALSRTMFERAARDPGRVLGRAVPPHRLDEAADQDQEHQLHRRRLDQVVRGRHAERVRLLPRPASGDARRSDRDHLGERRPVRQPSTSPIASCTSRSAGWPTR